MDLRADESGFLIGASRISLDNEKERLQLLRAIKADTAAMLAAIEDGAFPSRLTRSPAPAANITALSARVAHTVANDAGPSSQPQEPQRSASVRRLGNVQEGETRRVATPQRGIDGRFVPGASDARETATPQRATDDRVMPGVRNAGETAVPQRGADGRFMPASSSGETATPQRGANGRFMPGVSAAETATAKTGQRKLLAGLSSILSSMRSGVGGAGDGGESVDPTISAAKEFGSLISPITMPIKGLMGAIFRRRPADAEQKIAVPWYRRIWSELRGINQKSGAGGGRSMLGAIGGALGGLLSSIPGVTLPGRRRRTDITVGSPSRRDRARERLRERQARRNGNNSGNVFKRLAKSTGGLLGGLGQGLLKRIPLLGALVSGGSALASIFGIGDQTREERFKGAGGGIGALIGGGLGTLLGPVGTVVGGILGDMIGTQVGEWLSTVDWGKVGDSITEAWDTVTSTIGDGWKWVQNKFSGTLDAISSTFTGLKDGAVKAFEATTNWAKEKAVAAKDAVKGAVDKVSAKAAPVVNAAKAKAGSLYEAATIEGGRLVGKLDKGYRHKERFDGINGGESLAKYGSYTNAEADRIRELKTSGANTSANLKGGMPQDIRNKIIAKATEAGLKPEDMLQIAALESGGNPNAISSTGATGVYQMTGQTATGLGITDRFDADQNIAGGMKLAQANAEQLRRKGLPVNRDNLYMMHQLGPTAATDLIQGAAKGKNLNELSAGTQTAASMNYGKGAKTAKDYLTKNSMALDARLGQVSKTVPTTLAAITPVSAAAKASAVPMVTSAASSIDKQALGPVPMAPRKIADNSKKSDAPLVMAPPLTQNIADRGLAQAATGGIGMNLGVR